MLKDSLDRLIEIASNGRHSDDILEARKEYQSITGNIYEDDKSYESRIALFLEWYIFDRISPKTDQILLEVIIYENRENWSPTMMQKFEQFTNNIHGLFIVKKIREHSIKIFNLFNNQTYEVNQSFPKLIFSKSIVFEGRLISYDDMYHFTGSFCFHPLKAKNYIKGKIKHVSVIIHKNEKRLKNMSAQLKNEKKTLDKIIAEIDN